jgi:hypothetical protein
MGQKELQMVDGLTLKKRAEQELATEMVQALSGGMLATSSAISRTTNRLLCGSWLEG